MGQVGLSSLFSLLPPLGYQKHHEQVSGSFSLPLMLLSTGKGLGNLISASSQGTTAQCVGQGHISETNLPVLTLNPGVLSFYTGLES